MAIVNSKVYTTADLYLPNLKKEGCDLIKQPKYSTVEGSDLDCMRDHMVNTIAYLQQELAALDKSVNRQNNE